jgi:hypothetical protein
MSLPPSASPPTKPIGPPLAGAGVAVGLGEALGAGAGREFDETMLWTGAGLVSDTTEATL